jgi:sec-independent protein translocase protein TatA
MFGLGTQELLLILLVIILLFGARKIPEIARGLGRSIGEFKKGMRDSSETEAKSNSSKEDLPPDQPAGKSPQ